MSPTRDPLRTRPTARSHRRTLVWVVLILLLVGGNAGLVIWLQGSDRPGAAGSGFGGTMGAPSERIVPLRRPTASETGAIEEGKAPAPSMRLRVEIVDGTGHALAGAALQVRADRRAVRSPFPEPFLADGISGADGAAEFALPPRARYRVDATMDGHAPATGVGSGLLRLRLPSPASIRGRVVEQGTGLPIAGMVVDLLPPQVVTWARHRPDLPFVPVTEAVATSAADGTFAFTGLGPGPRRVLARALGNVRQGWGTAVDVLEGEDACIEVSVTPTADLPGRVVYVGSDKPVAGGSLRIAMVEIYGALDFQEVPLDGNGEFLLARVPLGIARGCTITTADGTRIDAMIPSAVRSAAGGRVAEKVTVSVPWNTKGRSFDYRGRVVDTRGNPVPGARVLVGYELESAVAVRDRGGYANVRESRTGADGQFDVGGLGFASREILVLHPAFPPVEFPLSAGEPLQGVTITVPDPNRLLVRVRDADGKPVPDVEVRALLHHSDTYNNGWWVFGDVLEGLRANPVTDSDGQALVTLIGPGNWYIAARSADESRCGRVPIRWDGSGSNAVDLVLEAPPSLEGRVVDTDGSPVEGARISLQDDLLSGTRGTQTDSAGRFAFAGVAVAPALGVNAGCARLFLDWDPRFHPALPGVEFLDAVPGTPVEWMVERTQVK